MHWQISGLCGQLVVKLGTSLAAHVKKFETRSKVKVSFEERQRFLDKQLQGKYCLVEKEFRELLVKSMLFEKGSLPKAAP